MNNHYDEYEEEIDLIKLMFYCLSKWKSMIAVLLVGIVLGVGFSFFKASKSDAIVTEPLDKDGIERTVKKEELMAKASEYYEKYKEQIDAESTADNSDGTTSNKTDDISEELASAIFELEKTNLFDVDADKMCYGEIKVVSFATDEEMALIRTALESYAKNGVVYNDLDCEYTPQDLEKLISLEVINDENSPETLAVVKTYGANAGDVTYLLALASESIRNMAKFAVNYTEKVRLDKDYELSYYAVSSDITQAKNPEIAEYQDTLYKKLTKLMNSDEAEEVRLSSKPSIKKYAVIFALVAVVVYCGIIGMKFIFRGGFNAVTDINAKFGTKYMGSVRVYTGANKFDKWIFEQLNGVYSSLPESEQKKVVELNVLNELKKEENIHNIMLVSTMTDKIGGSARFIKTALENAGYSVSECVDIVKDTDKLGNTDKYDLAIVIEDTDKSSAKLVREENKLIKNFIGKKSYTVLV